MFGDYDVDGITSTVLLLDYLKSCGVRCLRYIPRRIEDGYGLSKDAIQGLRDQGATLMITVDCGITGNEEVDFAASIGHGCGSHGPPRMQGGAARSRGGGGPPPAGRCPIPSSIWPA